MNGLRITRCSLLFLIATATAMAQGTYTQIDYPGSSDTFAFGINNAGEVTGYYGVLGSSYSPGYFLSNGVFTSVSYGPNTSTLFRAMNDNDQIVGINTQSIAFVYDRKDQTFTVLPDCNGQAITPTGLNNGGMVVGFTSASLIGFETIGATCKQFSAVDSSQTEPEGITTSGTVVGHGQSIITSEFISFSYRGGHLNKILLPYPGYSAYGVSPSGNAVVATSTNSASSFVVYRDGSSQALTFPGANFTFATGINDAGEVVGSFTDSKNVWHGFTWTPSATAPKP